MERKTEKVYNDMKNGCIICNQMSFFRDLWAKNAI